MAAAPPGARRAAPRARAVAQRRHGRARAVRADAAAREFAEGPSEAVGQVAAEGEAALADGDAWKVENALKRFDGSTTRSLEYKKKRLKAEITDIQKDSTGTQYSIPPTGNAIISYTRLLSLLTQRRVKRLWLYGDADVAVVEVTTQGWDSKREGRVFEVEWANMRPYLTAEENKELSVEKERFLCHLPADLWDDGSFLKLIKSTWPQIDNEGRAVPHIYRHNACQLSMVPLGPHPYWTLLFTQAKTLAFAVGLRIVYDLIAPLIPDPPPPEEEGVEEQFVKARAKIFNMDADDPLFQEVLEKENLNLGIGGRGTTGVLFEDVAGIDHVVGPLKDAINCFMKTTPEYNMMNIEAPKGILLYGPPGTGKTMVARAIAGEAGVPFFSISGSEFVEMYEGVAASRMADLFAQARAAKPSIVFIDEIDTIGAARRSLSESDLDSGSREREMGLIRMLYELDGGVDEETGKSANEGIIFIAATNRPDALDQALVRSGRFDMRIPVGNPNERNRKKILEVHSLRYLGSLPRDDAERDRFLEDIAEKTIGYSGAELVNLLNEMAIITVRKGKTEANWQDFLEAHTRYTVGVQRKILPTGNRMRNHLSLVFAARAVCGAYEGDKIGLVSVVPTGSMPARIESVPYQYLGRDGEPIEDGPLPREQTDLLVNFMREIELIYTGRAVEEVFYGKGGVTTYTANEAWWAATFARYIVNESYALPPKERHGEYGKGWGKLERRDGRASDADTRRKMSDLKKAWEDPLSVFNTDEFIADRASPVRWAQPQIGPYETFNVDPTHAMLDHVLTSVDIGVLQVQAVAYEQAKERVTKLEPVIRIVAKELATAEDGLVEGTRITELLEEHRDRIERCGRVRAIRATANPGTVVFSQERPNRAANNAREEEDRRRMAKEARIGPKVAMCTFSVQNAPLKYRASALERVMEGVRDRTSTVLTEPWFRQILREQEWDAAGVGQKAHKRAVEQGEKFGDGVWRAENLEPFEGPQPYRFDAPSGEDRAKAGMPLWMPKSVEISDKGYPIFQGQETGDWLRHIAQGEVGEHYTGVNEGGFDVGPSDLKLWTMNVDYYRKFFSPYGIRHRKGYRGRLPFTPLFLTPDKETRDRAEQKRNENYETLPKHRTVMEDSPTLRKLEVKFADIDKRESSDSSNVV